MSSSIEIPIAGSRSSAANPHSIQTSLNEAGDFVVLGESPVVQFLSGGDALDELTVQMGSLTGLDGTATAEHSAVHSVSLRADIEKLTTENDKLKKTAMENSLSLKKHVELCTMWREQMTKCHERDALMIEEARQETLKLQDESAALRLCLESTQRKLEDAIVDKYRLEKNKALTEQEVASLKEELAQCHEKLDEWEKRAEEVSFVHIEAKKNSDSTESSLGATAAAEAIAEERLKEISVLRSEKVELTQEIEAERTITTALKQELEVLKSELDDVYTAKREAEALKLECDRLRQQVSLNEGASHEQREKLLDDLQSRLLSAERENKEARVELAALETSKRAHCETTACLNKATAEIEELKKEVRQLAEEKRSLQDMCAAAEESALDLKITKERLAALSLLQSDQVSELEAFREALRIEQADRQKVETEYKNLLQTWQNFESAQTASSSSNAREQSQVDQAAIDLANAERVKFETELRALRETIKDLQAQNVALVQERQVNTVQRAGVTADLPSRTSAYLHRGDESERELRCPLCRMQFSDQMTLIQHAGVCENETGSLL